MIATGIITRKNGKFITLGDGTSYSCWDQPVLDSVNINDNVSFTYFTKESKGNTYNNIKGGVQLLAAGVIPTAATGSVSTGGSVAHTTPPVVFGNVPIDRQRSIIRQNCVGNAISLLSVNFDGADLKTDEVLRVAGILEEYCTGDADYEAATMMSLSGEDTTLSELVTPTNSTSDVGDRFRELVEESKVA